MMEFWIGFLVGCLSTVVVIAAIIAISALYFFFTYGKYLNQKNNPEKSKADQLRATRRAPYISSTEDL